MSASPDTPMAIRMNVEEREAVNRALEILNSALPAGHPKITLSGMARYGMKVFCERAGIEFPTERVSDIAD